VREGFVPLASLLRGDEKHAEDRVPAEVAIAAAVAPPSAHVPPTNARENVVANLARMRLFALEAFERGVESMLASFARDVLARELAIAPPDLSALASQALAAFHRDEPIRLVVAPADAARVTSPLPLRVDPSLRAGDLVVEVDAGAFESPLAFRFSSALDASLAYALERSA
jgi:flagellar biosynthesis/type III secretory pathway protein FliH